jgi:hypothetical protein
MLAGEGRVAQQVCRRIASQHLRAGCRIQGVWRSRPRVKAAVVCASHEVADQNNATAFITPHFQVAGLARGTPTVEVLEHGQRPSKIIDDLEESFWVTRVITLNRRKQIVDCRAARGHGVQCTGQEQRHSSCIGESSPDLRRNVWNSRREPLAHSLQEGDRRWIPTGGARRELSPSSSYPRRHIHDGFVRLTYRRSAATARGRPKADRRRLSAATAG